MLGTYVTQDHKKRTCESACLYNERSGHFCRLYRTCRLIEHRCAWDDGSVSRLFIWRRNWAGWQFPSHSFDMWHDSEASSRCHIFNWLLRSSNQHPAINKNRIVVFVYHRYLCRMALCLPLRSSSNECPPSAMYLSNSSRDTHIRLTYIRAISFWLKASRSQSTRHFGRNRRFAVFFWNICLKRAWLLTHVTFSWLYQKVNEIDFISIAECMSSHKSVTFEE